MELACCSRDEAIELLKKTGNVLDAVSLHMNVPKGKDAPKPRQLSAIQQFFKETREEMTALTESISKGFIASDQAAPSEYSEMQAPPVEMAPRNSCLGQCHPLSLESVVQIPEIACQSPSVCFSDLQSNDQRLPCSDLECLRSSPTPGKESSGTGAETTA